MGIYGVCAEVFALAGLAMLSHPDLIKLVHGLLYDFWIISQDAGLEVTRVISFHADAGTSKIGTTDISLFATPDKVGTGTEDIVTLCKDKGLKSPEYHQEEDFRVVIWRQGGQATGQVKGQVAGQVAGQVKETIRRLVLAIGGQTLTRKEIMEILSLKGRDNFRVNYLEPAMTDGYVAKLYPESDNRPDQAYYLTEKGKELLKIIP